MARKVGFFHNGSKASFQKHYAAFVRRLHQSVEEEDIKIVERWGRDDTARSTDQHLSDLIGEKICVLVAAGGPPSAKAAKQATKGSDLPVVFMSVADPVGLELVSSLESPGTNMTGIAGLTSELDLARLQILREFFPGNEPKNIGLLSNSSRPQVEDQLKKLRAAAAPMKLNLVEKGAADLAGIESAFKQSFGRAQVDALLVTADSLFNDFRERVVKLTDGVPAIFQWREFAEAGGYMSFGPNIIDAYERVAEYVGLILDGEKPADLPVSLPDRFEFVINIATAYADPKGFRVPASLLSRAELVRPRLRTKKSIMLRSAG